MKIFQDIFTEDELLSDSYAKNAKDIDDVVWEVPSRFVKKGGEDFGIETEDEGGVDDAVETVNEIEDAFQLQETAFSNKKGYIAYLKAYLKRVKEHLEQNNPDRVDAFMQGSAAFTKKVVKEFKEYQFFCGPSIDQDAMIVLCRYKEDGMTPYFYYFKDGLKEVKY
eukprot:gb/GECH01007666.1/.p1 GENE.gb/GECH01007666.1/~~gb/GECH01007666.1/.p1  ORF type:complete len:166 (+),score=46.54 gb/GECH01007666.1/:1-498(+)